MSPDQVVAILTVLADLQLRISQLEQENGALRRVLGGESPIAPSQPPT